MIAGGVAGTGLRFGIDTLVPHTDSSFPLSTLIVNILGALALGLLVSRIWPTAPPWLRAGLGAGLLGSFTTFSAFAVSLVSLGRADEWMLALAYLAATLLLGFGAAAVGLRLGGLGRSPVHQGRSSLDVVDE